MPQRGPWRGLVQLPCFVPLLSLPLCHLTTARISSLCLWPSAYSIRLEKRCVHPVKLIGSVEIFA